jgi:hypothetical protein
MLMSWDEGETTRSSPMFLSDHEAITKPLSIACTTTTTTTTLLRRHGFWNIILEWQEATECK